MLNFSFFGQKSRVNNLAIFLAKMLPRKMAKLLTLHFFTLFLLKLVFFSKISFSLQKEEDFWKTKKEKKNNKKEMAKLLTYDGQVIDPTAYIYIYTREREK